MESPDRKSPGVLDKVETWLRRNWPTVIVSMAVCGFLLRLYQAVTFYLNPDEAWHFLLASPSAGDGVMDLLRRSAKVPHPPLFIASLGMVARFVRQEWLLRLFFVLSGSLFPVVLFLWLRKLAGLAAATSAFTLLLFSPPLIGLSAELRGYMPAFLLITAAAYVLEAVFERASLRRLLVFHGLLYAAILMEFCIVWIVASLGVYALLRLWQTRAGLRIWLAWSVGQLGALALYGFLYKVQTSQPTHQFEVNAAINGWLSTYFFHPGDSVVKFLVRSSAGLFEYVGGSLAVGFVVGVLWLIGIYKIWCSRRMLAALVVLPVFFGAAGAVLRLLPYGASRHSAYQSIFIAAVAGVAIAFLCRERISLSLPAALILTVIANVFAVTPYITIPSERHQLSDMRAAIDYLVTTPPASKTVITDHGTGMMLTYYLGSNDPASVDIPPYASREIRGIRIIEAPGFSFEVPVDVQTAIEETRKRYKLDSPLWVAVGGFVNRVETPIDRIKSFTDMLTLYPVPPAK